MIHVNGNDSTRFTNQLTPCFVPTFPPLIGGCTALARHFVRASRIVPDGRHTQHDSRHQSERDSNGAQLHLLLCVGKSAHNLYDCLRMLGIVS